MRFRDLADLILLGALWGVAFLFMRIAAPEMGPVPMVGMRLIIGALLLVPLLIHSGGLPEFKREWRHVTAVGFLNSAVPFCLLSFAVLYLSAGYASVINASATLWGGLIAVIWLGDRLNLSRGLGLLVGFSGVVILVWDNLSLDTAGESLAIPAALLAAFSYGLAANYSKKHLDGIGPVTVAAGSYTVVAVLLIPAVVWLWPDTPVSLTAWVSVTVLGVACTAWAGIIYFRLITRAGPTVAISVAYLIPAFGMLSGAIFLAEVVTLRMLVGCGIILLGTALVTNMLEIAGRRGR